MRRERREIDRGCSAGNEVSDDVGGSGREQDAVAMVARCEELRSMSIEV
jgi:hypothetical protein